MCVIYDPRKGFELTDLKKAIVVNSGTENFLTNSALRKLSTKIIDFYHVTIPVNRQWFSEDVFTTETNNPKSEGFEASDHKRNTVLDMQMMGADSATKLSCAQNLNDFLPIQFANPTDIIYLADYHEARRAYNQNKRFAFLLDEDQKRLLFKRGWKVFKMYFIRKLSKK